MKFHFTRKSTNKKTGPIPVSTSPMETCPTCCPLKDNGCYADGGPLLLHWRKISEGQRGESWSKFLKEISALPDGQLWRHNQAGDLVPKFKSGGQIHEDYLNGLILANIGRRGFTYTHYPVLHPDAHAVICEWNRTLIKSANDDGFTINLSGNDPAHADQLYDLEIAPVTTHLPSSYLGKVTHSPRSRKIVVCPAIVKTNISCENCGLCAKYPRKSIIGFPAHGMRKGKVDRFIQLAEEINV